MQQTPQGLQETFGEVEENEHDAWNAIIIISNSGINDK